MEIFASVPCRSGLAAAVVVFHSHLVFAWEWSLFSSLFQDGRRCCSCRLLHLFKMADATSLVICRDVTFSWWPTLLLLSSSPHFQDGRRNLSRHLPWRHFFTLTDAAALVVCRDVIVELWKGLQLPASSFHENVGHGRGLQIFSKSFWATQVQSLTRLRKPLPGSHGLHTLVEAGEDNPSAWSRLPAFHKIPPSMNILRSSWHSFHQLSRRSWVHPEGFYQALGNITFRHLLEKTWHSSSRVLASGFHKMRLLTWCHQFSPGLALCAPVVSLTRPRRVPPEFPICQLSTHLGEDTPRVIMSVLISSSWPRAHYVSVPASTKCGGYPTLARC